MIQNAPFKIYTELHAVIGKNTPRIFCCSLRKKLYTLRLLKHLQAVMSAKAHVTKY